MTTVTLSNNFEINIPQEIREALQLDAGIKLRAIVFGGRLELIPVRQMKEMRGYLRGMNTNLADAITRR